MMVKTQSKKQRKGRESGARRKLGPIYQLLIPVHNSTHMGIRENWEGTASFFNPQGKSSSK